LSESQVKPSPSGTISTPQPRGGDVLAVQRLGALDELEHPTRMSRPVARSRSPSAARALPLPSPVFTITSPLRLSRGGTRYGPGRFFLGHRCLRFLAAALRGARGIVWSISSVS
jgi:hypothetical protein